MPADITAQLTVTEVLDRWPATVAVFERRGMACLGCAMARFYTVGEAASEYGLEVEDLLGELRRATQGEGGGQE